MIFTRPKDVTLTQMAQWIDTHIVVSEEDKNKQVEYLYHLVYSKAKQIGYFNDPDTHDDFVLYGVTKLLTRLNNKEEQNVKSVTNYIRISLQHWYAEYVRLFCCGCADNEMSEFDVTDFGDYLIDVSSENDYKSLMYDCSTVSLSLLRHLKRIPTKHKSSEWVNIAISCFLTLQNRIDMACAIAKQKNIDSHTSLSKIVRQLKCKPPVLFHIDETMSTYINVLVNELIHVLSVELASSSHTNISASECLKNMVAAALNDEEP